MTSTPRQGLAALSWRSWFISPPTRQAQTGMLGDLSAAMLPLLNSSGLPTDFQLRPGRGTAGRFGSCTGYADGRLPVVTIRCIQPGPGWRAPGAIVATLLHEAAHLRYRSHGPRFWALLRRLLLQATKDGLYRPEEDDPSEARKGNTKLNGTAADSMAQAAHDRRRAVYLANRTALAGWQPGQRARVARGRLSGSVLEVVATRRSRVEVVAAPDGIHYLVPAAALVPAPDAGSETRPPSPDPPGIL